jgi:hypothetical protein
LASSIALFEYLFSPSLTVDLKSEIFLFLVSRSKIEGIIETLNIAPPEISNSSKVCL